MSPPKPRAHLVERAVEALGGATGLAPLPPPGGGLAAPPPSPGGLAAPPGSPSGLAAPPPSPGGLAAPPGSPSAGPPAEARTSPEARAPGTPAPGAGAPEARPPGARPVAPPGRPPVPIEALRRAGLDPSRATRTRLGEEVAVVFNQLLGQARLPPPKGAADPRLILVTSARPGEGKTFTALHLAAGMALSGGQPVLLVDADGKKGSLGELLGLEGEPGLRDLAVDPTRPVAPLVVPTAIERLSILPVGRGEGSASIAYALRPLALAFPRHVLVFDSPPCLSTSEASLLAPVVGQVLMVVEAERTQRSELEAALDMVEACPTIQLVLNQTRMNTKESFGGGSYGAYGGTYYDAPARG